MTITRKEEEIQTGIDNICTFEYPKHLQLIKLRLNLNIKS